MRRRQFLTLVGGAAAVWPRVANTQQLERRVALLMGLAKDAEADVSLVALREGLQNLGWIDGRNLRIDERWAADETERLPGYVAEIVRLKPDVIMVRGRRALAAMRQMTRTIPIVFVGPSDPIGGLALPGANVTGFTIFELNTINKAVEALKGVMAEMKRLTLIFHADNALAADYSEWIKIIAPTFNLTPVGAAVRSQAEIEKVIETSSREPSSSLLAAPDVFLSVHRELIVALAAHYSVPAAYTYRDAVLRGGLVSYGIDLSDLFHRVAAYIDRILRGEKPSDLRMQAPTKFQLAVNLKTAKVLGLTFPPALVARADEVIK